MHTSQLKKDFPEVYRDFFNKYDLVVSAPIIFMISWLTLSYSNGNAATMDHKLPLRNYIWINFHKKSSRIEFTFRVNSETDFQKWDFNDYYAIPTSFFENNNFGEVGFLSEYNWIDTPSIIADISVSKLLLDKEISLEDVALLDLKKNYSEILKKVLDKDMYFLKEFGLLKNTRNTNFFVSISLLASDSTVLTLEKNKNPFLYNLSPITFDDYGLGICVINTNAYTKSFFQTPTLYEYDNDLKQYFLEKNFECPGFDFHDCVDGLSFYYATEAFRNLERLCNNDHKWDVFFENLHFANRLKFLLFRDTYKYFVDMKSLNTNVKELQKSKDTKGCILQSWSRLVSYGEKIFEMNEAMLDKLGTDFGFHFTLDYSSRLDGFEKEWVRVEQYRSQGIFSEFLSPFSLRTFAKKQEESTDFGEYEELTSHDWLIIDPELKKIFLNGKPLNSKDLPTQKTLVDVLVLLFLKKQSTIRSSDLPLSSYSKNKNDFVGKVISPIHGLLRECGFTGTLLSTRDVNNGFQIVVGSRDFEIGFVERRE